MSFDRFTAFARFAFLLLSFQGGALLYGQVPLTADRIGVVDTSGEIELGWRIESATSALDAGLPGLAETIYRSLLENSAASSAEQMASLQLGLAKSLIGQRRYVAARAQLDAISEEFRASSYSIYLAISIYGDGTQVDAEAFTQALQQVSKTTLPRRDLPWFELLKGLEAELAGETTQATRAFERAVQAAQQPMLRSFFESLVLRQRIVSGEADEALASELSVKLNKFEGQAAAYPYVREYAVVLYRLGRTPEAIGAIDRELANTSAGYGAGEREQLRLLKGIILGADSVSGRAALKELVRNGKNREAMGIALQLLARAQGQDDDLFEFLKVMISRTQKHPLLGQMYYLRSQLALKYPEMMSIAEEDARILLQQFPGLSEITNVYRLLAYAALQREPKQYRAAADFLIQLRDQSTNVQELVGLNKLIGDCYFLNGDYANAVDFYSAARSREYGVNRDGALFLRLITAQVRVGSINAALQLIDEADFSGSVDIWERWRAEWNVAQALQVNGDLERALQRVRLLLDDSLSVTVPAALDIRLRWLEAYLSLEAQELEGLEERLTRLLARLDSLPTTGENALDSIEARLLKTEILLLQANVWVRAGNTNQGMEVLTQLRVEFADTAAAQRSYLIEAAYHGLVGDFSSAQTTMLNLAQTYPASPLAPQALFEAALYCERRGVEFYPQAVVLYNDLAERFGSDPLFYYARLKQGNLLRSMNDFAGAQIIYENLINGAATHPLRYVAELSRADCMLALAGNDEDALGDVLLLLERLLDLPNLPLDFQTEVAYKWAFALIKSDSIDQAKEVLWLSDTLFLRDGEKAVELNASGRYWVARSMLQLGEILEAEQSLQEARKIYRKMIAYNLPGRRIAISRADRLLNVE